MSVHDLHQRTYRRKLMGEGEGEAEGSRKCRKKQKKRLHLQNLKRNSLSNPKRFNPCCNSSNNNNHNNRCRDHNLSHISPRASFLCLHLTFLFSSVDRLTRWYQCMGHLSMGHHQGQCLNCTSLYSPRPRSNNRSYSTCTLGVRSVCTLPQVQVL